MRRPVALFVVLAALTALVPAHAALAAPATKRSNYSGPVPLPATGAYFGAYVNVETHTGPDPETALENYEAIAGRKMALDRVFYFWDQEFPTASDYAARDQGRILILSWSAWHSDQTVSLWKDIADGVYDADIDDRAAAVKAFGAPMFFAFNHEPENGGPGGQSAGTADEFIAAFRHVHDRFIADGVTNVSFTEILMAWTLLLHHGDTWYVGDNYIDVFAADGYNWYNCIGHQGPWRSLQEILEPFYNYGLSHNKPMLVAEFGSGEDQAVPGRKGQWLTDGIATFKSWPEIKGVAYFDKAPISSCARWIDTSPSSVSAYRAMGTDPYFNPTPVITITSAPADPTNATTATFKFSASESGSTFTCSLDGGAAQACTSPKSYNGLAEGDHSFTVIATDPSAVTGTPTTYNWTVSNEIVIFSSGPDQQTGQTSATFEFSASVPGSTFMCSLDGGAAEPCTSPATYNGLALGAHTLVVTATDPNSNSQSGSWSWSIVPIGFSVTVADFAFTPTNAFPNQGTAPEWTFNGPSGHTVTDSSGMNLWNSDVRGAGSTFAFTFIGAGTYLYKCLIHSQMKGRVKVPLTATPQSGNETTKFTITWSSVATPSGYVFDVQVLRPGSSSWENWWIGQAVTAQRFTPDSGPGVYKFRARLTNSVAGKSSGYSQPVSITVN